MSLAATGQLQTFSKCKFKLKKNEGNKQKDIFWIKRQRKIKKYKTKSWLNKTIFNF